MKTTTHPRDWAVKRAKSVTTFESFASAWRYAKVTLGATLLQRRVGRWEPV